MGSALHLLSLTRGLFIERKSVRYLASQPARASIRSDNPAEVTTWSSGDSERRAVASRVLQLVEEHPSQQVLKRDEGLLSSLTFHSAPKTAPSWKALETIAGPHFFLDLELRAAKRFQRCLRAARFNVPNVADSTAYRCSLTLRNKARRFRSKQRSLFLIELFRAIANSEPTQVTLSRFDLFHGHIFFTWQPPHQLGILFHAMEYPALGPNFKVNLGFCQVGSRLMFDQQAFDKRNWLYYKGKLLSLDLGLDSVLHNTLIMEGLQAIRTLLESDFGLPVADVYFFDELEGTEPLEKLYICPLKE